MQETTRMLRTILLFVFCWTLLLFRASKCEDVADFYSLAVLDINGKQVEFSRYEGKTLLVVNVASECGFTDGHYRALKRMHDILRFNSKFEILGETLSLKKHPDEVTLLFQLFPVISSVVRNLARQRRYEMLSSISTEPSSRSSRRLMFTELTPVPFGNI